ncbi:nitrogen assimilation regulatory NtrX domain protein [Orientia tsutsugamushi str. Gilliam]|uniref:Nitrogen assimilation regulatory NtrX domain protein n=1 Tax=Orientia tsutsugamushi str. Gilliam TaxID=1359184 RepID=A0A0F3MG19_ORITS|nr:nitrogen assimilation regulatory NtrX domain protein [Orientia tsutsugamushi str. Gilliam]
MGHVLIIDDEHDVRALLSDIVKSKGFTPNHC